MKNYKFLTILLAIGLVTVAYKWVACSTSQTETAADAVVEKSTIDDIMTRSSVRAYSDKEVEPEKIDTLLRAAMAAPTARNLQPWRFVVINDRALLDTISANFGSMTMAKNASLAIVTCGDLSAAMEGEGRDYWIQDVSAATENLLLAAHAMGLGAVWCGIYPVSSRVADFSALLSLPDNIIPMACVCIGYPAAESTPKDKWHPEYIRYNSWTDRK
ncbi:MAG: nitroreductase family protein [Barnesiella sp.]|nr:nitroreductase family protein [Barnesiella sp.]